MEVTRQQVQETDARKARNERSLALLIPIPPLETGKEAWAHVSLSKQRRGFVKDNARSPIDNLQHLFRYLPLQNQVDDFSKRVKKCRSRCASPLGCHQIFQVLGSKTVWAATRAKMEASNSPLDLLMIHE
jgi:hypothetical protein